MQPLEKTLRNRLDRTVRDARDVAEAGARASLKQLGVGEAAPFPDSSETQRDLRRKLRAHGRQLGDARNARTEAQEIDRLIEEVAYEHWHRMLFARFLAENNLLMYPDPDEPVPVTLQECEDLAVDEGAKNGWELASRFAARMLPEIFRPDSPVFQVELPPEHQQKLERLVGELPPEVFTASDSLGWVYQFWQSKKKDEVNASEVKIGARELPAVTQLFTEPYMVAFLLDNSLGAWWAGKRLTDNDLGNAESEEDLRSKAALPGVPLEYLRFVKVEAASSRFPTPTQVGYLHEEDPIANLTGNLPHWRQDGVTYFVTFRTADSIPQEKLKQWQKEKETWLATHPEPHDEKTKREFYELFPARLEEWLDNGYGECLLSHDRYRKIVEDALSYFEGKRYHLHDYVVMPNHVHVLVTPLGEHGLSDILHSWKSFTASQINKSRGHTGAFWQKESFDHIVRGPAQLEKIRQYIRNHFAYGRGGKRQDAASTVWVPAAGTFDGWPRRLSKLKVLDPCCGSGHFLVAAFLMLVPMRMELEGLTVHDAVDSVLRDNLHGLEIDRRCTEIAAFNLALAAWRLTGFRSLPTINIACTGLSLAGTREQWMSILDGQGISINLRFFFGQFFDLFRKAPTLGSLINPHRFLGSGLLDEKSLADLHRVLSLAMAEESKSVTDRHEMGTTAQGLVKAAELLTSRYTLVVTNVPYLGRGKQDEVLKEHLETHYPLGKADLATAFVLRCMEFCAEGGTTALVTPQNWLFLTTYTKLRQTLLMHRSWNAVARLGAGAFETISGHVVNVALSVLSAIAPTDDHSMAGIDVSAAKEPEEKAAKLRGEKPAELMLVKQAQQMRNPDAVIALEEKPDLPRLGSFADGLVGMQSSDDPMFITAFWEHGIIDKDIWELLQGTPDSFSEFDGQSWLVRWEKGKGLLFSLGTAYPTKGLKAVGKPGVAIHRMGQLFAFRYAQERFHQNVAAIIPHNRADLPAIWCFCSSPEYGKAVRQIDQALKVTNATLVKVSFDLAYWHQVAAEKYPNGLPEPESDDPTQWLFHGYPGGKVEAASSRLSRLSQDTRQDAASTLHVAVARLLGYRWPAELDEKMRLSRRARDLVRLCDELLPFADKDGIVCIPPARGEASGADRLLNLLAKVYGKNWSTDALGALLKDAGFGGKSLEVWLRDGFFAQHCELFHQRPFIWQIWDGLRDGFSALVSYHKLDRKNLETLIYTYLGDWISRLKVEAASSRLEKSHDGSSTVSDLEEKLSAAEALKRRLELILKGEAPYDIFVRWKPLHAQPIGWEPDLNDGVRMNIRPFISVPDVKTKGAGLLRTKPKIKWDKDRGKEPKRPFSEYPWFWGWDGSVDFAAGPNFTGDRFNDCHYTISFKRQARQIARQGIGGSP